MTHEPSPLFQEQNHVVKKELSSLDLNLAGNRYKCQFLPIAPPSQNPTKWYLPEKSLKTNDLKFFILLKETGFRRSMDRF